MQTFILFSIQHWDKRYNFFKNNFIWDTTFLDFLTDRTVKIPLRKGQKNLKMDNVESWALSYRKQKLTFFSVGLCWKQNSLWLTENWFPQISD
jgi:hypothetical protein